MAAEDDPVAPTGSDALLPSSESVRALQELVQIERERIGRDNQRTAVIHKAFEYADAQDQRQFQYATQTRDAQVALEEARLRFFRRFVWMVLAAIVTTAAVFLGFALFGDQAQRELVGKIVTPELIAVAGWGFFAGLFRALKALSRGSDPTA